MLEVKLEKFEGPLDLLLELIQAEKLPISEISLSKVTDDFLEYFRKISQIKSDSSSNKWAGELADFLVIASQLILIKSRSLLPGLKLTEEEEQSIEDLKSRLAQYQLFRNLSKEIRGLIEQKRFFYSREPFLNQNPIFYPPKRFKSEFLFKSINSLIKSLPSFEFLTRGTIQKIVSLEEKIRDIQDRLGQEIQTSFSNLLSGAKEKIEIIVSFLAILELVKQKILTLIQEKPFDEIFLSKTSQDSP